VARSERPDNDTLAKSTDIHQSACDARKNRPIVSVATPRMSGRMSEPSGNTGLRPRGTRGSRGPASTAWTPGHHPLCRGGKEGHAVAPCCGLCALKFQLSKAFSGGLIGSCQDILLAISRPAFLGEETTISRGVTAALLQWLTLTCSAGLTSTSLPLSPPARHAPKACRGPSHLVISNCSSAFPFRSLS
jgi:hypothetical protein